MFVKLLALFLILGVCLAVPVEDHEHPVYVGIPVGTVQPNVGNPPPPKKDNSDLQTDATSWWHRYNYHHNYPTYHYNVHTVPTYYHTYWHTHY